MSLREFEDGQTITRVLAVREVETRRKRDGAEYLRLVLGDRTGTLPAILWDDVAEAAPHASVGSAVHVSGRYSVHARYGPQLTLTGLRPADDDEYRHDELLDGPGRSVDALQDDLRQLVETVQNPHLRRLLERFFGERSEAWGDFCAAPAAKYYHQAYRHGLLEHCLSVAQGVSAIAAHFPGIDRDTAVTGALLHDIGKLQAYAFEGHAIEMTDAGRLQGEIALGYYRVRRQIEDLPDFPPALAQAVLHIILSHHGTLEHGSPVVPCTREATLVHMIDNLGGRLGSFDRLEKELPEGQQWSGFDRALEAAAYFAAAHDESREAA